jgi:hypothetical protein
MRPVSLSFPKWVIGGKTLDNRSAYRGRNGGLNYATFFDKIPINTQF